MENKARKLTERQRRFADLYLQLGNACEAAEQAGFKRSYAQGAMRQPAVQEYIGSRIEEVRSRNVASADEVLAYLTAVMRGDIDGEKLGKRLGIFNDVSSVLRPEMPVIVDDIPPMQS